MLNTLLGTPYRYGCSVLCTKIIPCGVMMYHSVSESTNASTGTVLSIRPMRVAEAWRVTPV